MQKYRQLQKVFTSSFTNLLPTIGHQKSFKNLMSTKAAKSKTKRDFKPVTLNDSEESIPDVNASQPIFNVEQQLLVNDSSLNYHFNDIESVNQEYKTCSDEHKIKLIKQSLQSKTTQLSELLTQITLLTDSYTKNKKEIKYIAKKTKDSLVMLKR